MSDWLGITNSHLYQTRLLLDQQRSIDTDVPNDYQRQSLSEALEVGALLVLHQGWLAYLHELAEMVGLRHPIKDLEHLLSCTPLKTGEMQEIINLIEPPSWLSDFLKAAQRPDQMRQIKTGRNSILASNAATSNLIATSNQDTTETGVVYWFHQLSNLIDQQRENRQES